MASAVPRPLTPEQVAERWGCSANHVRNLIKRRELRAFRVGSRLLRIPPDAVVEFEQCQATIGSDDSMAATSSPGGPTASDGVIVLTHSRPRTRSAKPST
ncbi:helix-turn-helix domain-containing protein [Methylobacterium frigidaeris]|uniref:helix-turn-helix domain-containing protein n=1 Tax=Methylobacterium frigidaeris TaxID=2038277 RepID=UPI003F6899D4